MKLTDEQRQIISEQGDIKVNAVAGSGKTTTLQKFASKRPDQKILYLAFNRSVRQEAASRFEKARLSHVTVQTAHALAYRAIVPHYRYKIAHGYKTHEVVDLLNIPLNSNIPHAQFMLANHILQFVGLFCNHPAKKVQSIDYLATIEDEKARAFVQQHYKSITKGTRLFLAKMDRGEIPVTHDFYLKKFQLAAPKLNYDVILFDEGQDASPVMLDIFLRQSAQKVIVGDVHQQIYGWRNAINALAQVDFPELALTNSFRFNQDIADLAVDYLGWKQHLNCFKPVSIQGCGGTNHKRDRAVLARTNLSLLKKAIQLIEDPGIKKIYFEGNFQTYTYAQDGTSLFDVLNLHIGKTRKIKSRMIASMGDWRGLQQYAEATEDRELMLLMDIVEEYQHELPRLIKKIKEKHIPDEQRGQADIIFSTVHRSKGMEYDEVILADDFYTEEDIMDMVRSKEMHDTLRRRLEEEINLLYVGCTRTRNLLHLPPILLPQSRQECECIQLQQPVSQHDTYDKPAPAIPQRGNKSATTRNAYKRWSEIEEKALTEMFQNGKEIVEIAQHLGRKPGAVYSRIKKLRLFDWQD